MTEQESKNGVWAVHDVETAPPIGVRSTKPLAALLAYEKGMEDGQEYAISLVDFAPDASTLPGLVPVNVVFTPGKRETIRAKIPAVGDDNFNKIKEAIASPLPDLLTEFFERNPERVSFNYGDNVERIMAADQFYWNMVLMDFIANKFELEEVFGSTSGPYNHLRDIAGEDFCDVLTGIAHERFNMRVEIEGHE